MTYRGGRCELMLFISIILYKHYAIAVRLHVMRRILMCTDRLQAIQVLHNTMAVRWCQISRIYSVAKVLFTIIRVMRRWIGVKFPEKNIT